VRFSWCPINDARTLVYRGPVRRSIATLILLAGCNSGAREPPDDAAQRGAGSSVAAEPRPAEPDPDPKLDPKSARKRACVSASLVGAEPRLHGLIRSLCAEWVEREIPGLALALVEPDAAPFVLGLGVRCAGEPTLVDAITQFRFGSVSKPVTAALALGLVDAGRISLTSSAGTLVPGYEGPAGLADPSLAALLSHRSGLREIDTAQLVEQGGAWLPALTRSAAAGTPGEYHYSNTGYAVIGAMLIATAGQDYQALVSERVAAPLGLESFTVDATLARAPACGHLEHDQDRQPIRVAEDLEFMPGDPSWMNPAGGVLGSATDLARFALAIGTEQLPGSAAMLEPGALLPSPHRTDERYGYGLRSWALDDGVRAYGHSGNNVAFASELLFVPGRRAIVLLANCGAGLPASLAAAERLLADP
jgi:CubicO group peptidase (beta-lactamase class C family)